MSPPLAFSPTLPPAQIAPPCKPALLSVIVSIVVLVRVKSPPA
jgi:hypothetical protein